MNGIALSLAGAALLAGSAVAAPAAPSGEAEAEARIPFLHIGRMRHFRAVDRETLYIQARRNEWYRVTTFSCLNLPWAHVIGVDTRGSAVFDRTSVLIVDGERCSVRSVVPSGPPPSRRERRRQREG
jgi:hypothetical protein